MKPIAKNSMKPLKKQLCFCLLTLFVVVGGSHTTPVVAQDYVLNMQHFLPEAFNYSRQISDPLGAES